VEIGIGLDSSLGVSVAALRLLAQEASTLGYTSAWTPSGAIDGDGFHVCAGWAIATADRAEGSLATGIAVIPVPLWTVASLVHQAATVSAISGGRFILGVGTGGIYSEEFRKSFGLPDYPAVGMMRDYLITLRKLLAGETVDYAGRAVILRGVQLATRPIAVPLYLAALGPQMLRLAGELADGVSLNWCTPAQRAWCRERLAEGAKRSGRPAGAVQVMEYIRICVDDDIDAARRALARAVLGYALARPGARKDQAYRGHFGRMGFYAVLSDLEDRRDAGASMNELIAACPDDLLLSVGYFGTAGGAAAAFHRLAEGLDTAVVRVVPARPGIAATRAVMEACRPALVGSS
jgi:5,10-methylenetetrahydromethanopterin reductase